jgi:hypothetical protein
MALLPIDEAQARLFARAAPVETETVPLAAAAGRWAADDIAARRTQPASELSAMDGYAIRFADLPGPWTLVGESAAGRPFAGTVGAGETARIFTGAALPDGADTVMIQEEVAASGTTIHLTGEGGMRGDILDQLAAVIDLPSVGERGAVLVSGHHGVRSPCAKYRGIRKRKTVSARTETA